jgi:hypothetical protein
MMATDIDTKDHAWFREFLAGRSEGEVAEIRAFAESAFPVKETEATISTLSNDCRAEDYCLKRKLEGRRRFGEAYSDLLRARGSANDPRADDKLMNIAQELESDAVRRLIAEPSLFDWHIWQKIEVLEIYMRDMEEGWFDHRVSRLFGSLKADLESFNLEKDE